MDCKLAWQIIIGTASSVIATILTFPLQFIIGITSSIIAAILTLWGQYKIQCYFDMKKYSKAQGDYFGHGVIGKGDEPRKLIKKPQSEARIIYEGKNRLKIELTHNKIPDSLPFNRNDGKDKRTWGGTN